MNDFFDQFVVHRSQLDHAIHKLMRSWFHAENRKRSDDPGRWRQIKYFVEHHPTLADALLTTPFARRRHQYPGVVTSIQFDITPAMDLLSLEHSPGDVTIDSEAVND